MLPVLIAAASLILGAVLGYLLGQLRAGKRAESLRVELEAARVRLDADPWGPRSARSGCSLPLRRPPRGPRGSPPPPPPGADPRPAPPRPCHAPGALDRKK